MALANAWIETHVILLAAPDVLDIVQKIPYDERAFRRNSGKLDPAVLHMVRIEIEHNEDPIRSLSRCLAVGDDLSVVGRMEPQRAIRLQRRMLVADPIDSRDQLLDVTGAIPVAVPDLVFLRFGVFLGSRNGAV